MEKTSTRLFRIKLPLNCILMLVIAAVVYDSEAVLENSLTNKTACVGQDVSLYWNYDNEKEIFQINWLKDGVVVLVKFATSPAEQVSNISQMQYISNGEVVIKNVSLEDSGIYHMNVYYRTPELSTSDDNIHVLVKDPPSLPRSESEDLNDSRRYRCYVDKPGTPAVQIYIKIGSVMYSSSSKISTLAEPVYCCVVGDAVECLAQNTNKLLTFCVNVFTPFGPELMRLYPNISMYTVKAGERLENITCSADCDPQCAYKWTKTGSILSNTRLLSYTFNDKFDSGTYTCVATRRPSYTGNIDITVSVIYAATVVEFYASFKPEETTVIVHEQDSLELLCEVDSYPGSTINITKAETVLRHETHSYQSSYFIEKAKCLDGGRYVCTSQNEHFTTYNTSSKSLTVYVTCPPTSVDEVHSRIFIPVALSYMLRVLVNGYPAPTVYRWYKKQSGEWTQITPNNHMMIRVGNSESNLTILNMSYADFGEYGVKADNGFGGELLTKTFQLFEEGKPKQPSNFRCHLSTSSSALIVVEWDSGLNGGFIQTFVIQYRNEVQTIWEENFVEETAFTDTKTMMVVLDNLQTQTVYIIRMYSSNTKGNSTFTAEYKVAILGDIQAEAMVSIGAVAGGGIVGGMVLGSVISIIALLIYRHYNSLKCEETDAPRRHRQKGEVTPEVYYNVAAENVEEGEHNSESRIKGNSKQYANEYEELKHRTEEQQYEQVRPDRK